MRALLAAILVWLCALAASAGVSLEGSTDALELVTASIGSIDYDVSWSNVTATALTTPGTTKGNINSATTTTITYRDSENNSPNTGTFSALAGWQSPATPVIGTWMPFQLAAGDRGIREISSFNSGTTFTSGTFALVLFRPLVTIPNTVANIAGPVTIPAPGIRIYPNSCIMAISVGSASASTLAGTYTIVER